MYAKSGGSVLQSTLVAWDVQGRVPFWGPECSMSGRGELGDRYSGVISRIMTMFPPVFVSLTAVKRRRRKMRKRGNRQRWEEEEKGTGVVLCSYSIVCSGGWLSQSLWAQESEASLGNSDSCVKGERKWEGKRSRGGRGRRKQASTVLCIQRNLNMVQRWGPETYKNIVFIKFYEKCMRFWFWQHASKTGTTSEISMAPV